MTSGPVSIGIILDGNRRWARERGLPTIEGHRQGFEKAKDMLDWAREAGVKEITLFAFSSENWNRAAEEVAYLMGIFERAFAEYFDEVMMRGFRLRFIGDRARLSDRLQALMRETEDKSAGNTEGTLAVAVSYGGRAEILEAVNELLAEGRQAGVSEAEFAAKLGSAGMRDPDLIIRTSGEKRLSGFLPWQSVYSELFFVDTYWPDFSKQDFDAVLAEYRARDRRFGA